MVLDNKYSVDTREDQVRLIVAFLAALKVLFGAFGINFFDDEQIAAIENLIPFLFVIYGIWKNNYVSEKGQAQKSVLTRNNLE